MKYFLFITSDYKPNPGGMAEGLDNMARALMDLGNKVKILAVARPDEKERIAFLENYEEWVSPFLVVDDERPKNWIGNKFVSLLEIMRCLGPTARHFLEGTSFFQPSSQSISNFRDILAKEKPDVIVFAHLDLELYPLVLFLIEEGFSYGIFAHDFDVYRNCYKINDTIRRGMILKGATWIVSNSQHTKSLLEKWGISSNKITIIHPPLSEKAVTESSKSYSIVKDANYNLITVSRLVKPKGVDIVLRALKILSEQGIPYQYTIGGDGPEREFLEGLAEELGIRDRVHFLGYLPEDKKWSVLRAADVFVMPSRVNPKEQHEGFGIVFIEAAAFGVPGVGSRAGGIPDAVLHGETGLLVPQESPEKLAEALIFLYQNPEKRKAMGEAGMKRAKSMFPARVIAARFCEEISKRVE